MTVAAANPFPALPIAEADDLGAVTVRTPTIASLLSYIDDELAAENGAVVALVGGYGSGKTHIAGEALRHARDRTRALYVRPQGTFVDLYRRFVHALGPGEIRTAVESRYRQTVADVVTGLALPADIAEVLLAEAGNPTTAASAVWSNSRIVLEKVQPSLEQELQSGMFAAVLTLLLRGGFDDAVFDWIAGEKPAAVLVDRGLDHVIGTEVAALEALRVLLRLCGRGTVLVIDELHTVSFDGAGVVEAVKELFEAAAAAGTVVVLAGAPDFLDELPRDARQRIGRVIEVQPLTTADVAELVGASQTGHPSRLNAADLTLMHRIADITNGNPRNVVRLCHQLYRRPGPVTRAGVEEAALRLFRDATSEHVHAEVGRALTAFGLPHVRDHRIGFADADYWVPRIGAALLIVDAVFDDITCTSVTERLVDVRAEPGVWPMVIVVGNVVADRYLTRLAEAGGVAPLCYDYRTFPDDFRTALTAQVAGRAPVTTAHEEATAAFAARDSDPIRTLGALGRAYDELCAAIPADWLPAPLSSLSEQLRTSVRRHR